MSGDEARLFAAAEVPAAVRDAFGLLRAKIAARIPEARWVRPEGIHLTLRFLGAVPRARIDSLGLALAGAAASVAPFRLTTAGAGLFGTPRRPRALWLALDGDVEAASALASAVERALEPLGFPAEDRPFRPHLTLARFAQERPAEVTEDAMRTIESGLRGIPVDVDALVLFESLLGGGGARYEARRACPLGGVRA